MHLESKAERDKVHRGCNNGFTTPTKGYSETSHSYVLTDHSSTFYSINPEKTKLLNDVYSIKIKQMELSYHVEKVIKEDIPRLQHGNDGLIYTCAESGYVVGTDERM
jgi:mRNA capping enzyme, catalytic domain